MKKLLITLLCFPAFDASYAQNTIGIFMGASRTDYPGQAKPLAGFRYISQVSKHAVLGFETSYEPFKVSFSRTYGTYINHDFKYSASVIYLSPMVGYRAGKRAPLDILFVPSLGITSQRSGMIYEHGFRIEPPPWDTISVDSRSSGKDQIHNFVMRVGLVIQKSFPVQEDLSVCFGGAFFYTPELYVSWGEVKPLIFGLHIGVSYRQTKIKEKE